MKRWFMLFSLSWLACALFVASVPASLAAIPAGTSIQVAQAPVPPPVPPPAPSAGRGPNERFYTVQSKLDVGGTFFLYTDLKGALREVMDRIKPMLSNPGMPVEAKRVYAVADQVVSRLGLYGVYDIGLSVIPDGNLNRAKCYISTPEGRDKGILALLGGQPHPFAALDRASAGTLIVIDGDCDTVAAWALLRQIAQDIGGAMAQTQLDQMLAQVKASSGLDLEAINASLGGNCSLFIDQDPAAQLMLPIPGSPLTLNAPRLTLMVKVKDAKLYDALKDLLQKNGGPQVQPEASDGKLKFMAINPPANPFWPLAPALATDGDYVYVSTHLAYIKQLANPAGPLLRDSDEFKALAAGLPAAGNGMAFVSPRFGQIFVKAVSDVAAAQSGPGQPANPIFNQALIEKMKSDIAGALTVRVNEPDGVLMVSRSKAGAAQYVVGLAVAPAAIVAAVALPNFIQARNRAQQAAAQARAQADEAKAKADEAKAKADEAKAKAEQMPGSSTQKK